MTTRTFTFKCEFCPTKVKVITEAPAEVEFDPDGSVKRFPYNPEEGVGGNSRNSDYEKAQLCPACGMTLMLM